MPHADAPPRPSLKLRLLALVAVAAARPLARARPHRIATVLQALRRGATSATADQAATARTAVVTVSARCAAPRSCLHRSLATVILCRLLGTWPTWATGVRTDPFCAHAWVAVDGTPVGEPAQDTGYTPILTVPPAQPS
ncbi:lasso peptide biosynthesis B2 protein, partial [Streptomyces swartbergensis]|uniref:lasso peptide biosynthesis B2 protein n=1 Tax=Streptomyces swartbergensis TaxID=487165 RepID=UPI000D1C9014